MHGEGKTYIGSSTQQTDGGGNAQFLVTLPATVPPGSFITSTATNNGKTSEFSNCVEVADAQVYMEKADEEEEYPCDEFLREEMTVTTFDVREDTGQFTLYVKNPFPYPDHEKEGEGVYAAEVGDAASDNCNHQGFPDRAYCTFYIPEAYYNTKQTLKLYYYLCTPPIFESEVSIFSTTPGVPSGGDTPPDEPGGCHEGLTERACIAAGGTYDNASGKCICPRR